MVLRPWTTEAVLVPTATESDLRCGIEASLRGIWSQSSWDETAARGFTQGRALWYVNMARPENRKHTCLMCVCESGHLNASVQYMYKAALQCKWNSTFDPEKGSFYPELLTNIPHRPTGPMHAICEVPFELSQPVPNRGLSRSTLSILFGLTIQSYSSPLTGRYERNIKPKLTL